MVIQSCKQTEAGWLVNGNMNVPNDPANADCRAVLEWVAEGNLPEPLEVPTIEQQRATMVVTRFQALAALQLEGLLTTVKTTMAGECPAGFDPAAWPLAQLAWENSLHFHRLSPTAVAVAQILQLTEERLDQLWALAATIEI